MTSQRPAFLSLCPAEPFRIFFPLATLLGISGVSLWPLFFSGLHPFYPGPMHARLMIEGFPLSGLQRWAPGGRRVVRRNAAQPGVSALPPALLRDVLVPRFLRLRDGHMAEERTPSP